MGRETDSLHLLAPLLLTGGKGADLVISGNIVLNTLSACSSSMLLQNRICTNSSSSRQVLRPSRTVLRDSLWFPTQTNGMILNLLMFTGWESDRRQYQGASQPSLANVAYGEKKEQRRLWSIPPSRLMENNGPPWDPFIPLSVRLKNNGSWFFLAIREIPANLHAAMQAYCSHTWRKK
jgi:hypothetical protein